MDKYDIFGNMHKHCSEQVSSLIKQFNIVRNNLIIVEDDEKHEVYGLDDYCKTFFKEQITKLSHSPERQKLFNALLADLNQATIQISNDKNNIYNNVEIETKLDEFIAQYYSICEDYKIVLPKSITMHINTKHPMLFDKVNTNIKKIFKKQTISK